MPSIPEEIIIRSIQKTANTEEMAILNKWLQKEEKNIAYYSQLEEIWCSQNKLPEKNFEKGWERLSSVIESRSLQSQFIQPSQKTKLIAFLRYTAAVFIGVLIATLAWKRIPFAENSVSTALLVQHVIHNKTGVQSVWLPDDSEVWLNENSKLTYPDVFTEGKREVRLEGNAYFDIRKNPEIPFIVQVENLDIEVTGTEFFIEHQPAKETFVTLISGGVNLNYRNDNAKEASAVLSPGEQAVINQLSGDIKIELLDTYYYSVWKDGVYRFDDEYLETISRLLAKRFDLDIYLSPGLKQKRFTGRITSEDNIQDVLIYLSKSYPIKYQITGNTIEIFEN